MAQSCIPLSSHNDIYCQYGLAVMKVQSTDCVLFKSFIYLIVFPLVPADYQIIAVDIPVFRLRLFYKTSKPMIEYIKVFLIHQILHSVKKERIILVLFTVKSILRIFI